mmetsp:Transcript_5342/g.10214  ORF Transcript_5342/g.10214 Transcript_5342/m.10214 type:complete len:223 (-) Transcript_5342:3362-4030(-)
MSTVAAFIAPASGAITSASSAEPRRDIPLTDAIDAFRDIPTILPLRLFRLERSFTFTSEPRRPPTTEALREGNFSAAATTSATDIRLTAVAAAATFSPPTIDTRLLTLFERGAGGAGASAFPAATTAAIAAEAAEPLPTADMRLRARFESCVRSAGASAFPALATAAIASEAAEALPTADMRLRSRFESCVGSGTDSVSAGETCLWALGKVKESLRFFSGGC